jgi:methoxymalonate biosynthesis acyl carrier protein
MPDESVALVRTAIQLYSQAAVDNPPLQDTDLFDAGLLESLALLGLMTEVEVKFGCRIPEEELRVENFRTIASILQLVERVRKTQPN